MKHFKIHMKIIFALAGIFGLLVVLAWFAPLLAANLSVGNWCDWYVLHIVPVWYNTYARFMSSFPFSVGEWMMYLGYILAAVTVILLLLMIPLRKQTGYRAFIKTYMLSVAYIAVLAFGVETLNCTIMYHTTELDGNHQVEGREYTIGDMLALYDYVVERCNTLCEQVSRDLSGNLLHEGDTYEESVRALHNLSDRYPQLEGYYPRPKPVFFSKLLTKEWILGVYYPWSMEANYNQQMAMIQYPVTICHELAHLHGIMREDEAAFIAVVAALESDDSFFQYSAYLNIYDYLFWNLLDLPDEDGTIWQYITEHDLSDQCDADNESFIEEDRDSSSWLDSDSVENVIGTVSDAETDLSLKLNGVEDGIASYNRMLDLVLQYFDGKLE